MQIGSDEGIWVWEIENFYPQLIEDTFYGQFYDADSYLVLKTKVVSGFWQIFISLAAARDLLCIVLRDEGLPSLKRIQTFVFFL